jgi:hydroxymethylpyrimidine/phosphomethylpyrimidine kinase
MTTTPTARAQPNVLTIAGSDPSGAAGVQVDLQVFRDFGAHGWSAVTAVIAQNTAGVRRVWPVSPEQLRAQLDAVFDDVAPDAIKVGALPTRALVEVVAGALRERAPGVPVVVDPVLASGDGATALAAADVAEAIASELAPWVTLLTPNLPELARLTGSARRVETPGGLVEEARRGREALGMRGALLLKAGHLPGGHGDSIQDALAEQGASALTVGLPAIGEDVRGTGCQLSSAIAAAQARGHGTVREDVEAARAYLNTHLRAHRARPGAGRPLISRAYRGEW